MAPAESGDCLFTHSNSDPCPRQALLSRLSQSACSHHQKNRPLRQLHAVLRRHLHQELVIISDDAGQFDVLRHALCWIHAERNIQSILPLNDLHVQALQSTREALWALYDQLKTYKLKPTTKAKRAINNRFDTLCKTKTDFQTLNQASPPSPTSCASPPSKRLAITDNRFGVQCGAAPLSLRLSRTCAKHPQTTAQEQSRAAARARTS